ncbi:MAG: hypothetical protein LBO71_07535 [Prevotellaceae bacterium]|nr:hypothetical protein [Prevotellaceae bacterium]
MSATLRAIVANLSGWLRRTPLRSGFPQITAQTSIKKTSRKHQKNITQASKKHHANIKKNHTGIKKKNHASIKKKTAMKNAMLTFRARAPDSLSAKKMLQRAARCKSPITSLKLHSLFIFF